MLCRQFKKDKTMNLQLLLPCCCVHCDNLLASHGPKNENVMIMVIASVILTQSVVLTISHVLLVVVVRWRCFVVLPIVKQRRRLYVCRLHTINITGDDDAGKLISWSSQLYTKTSSTHRSLSIHTLPPTFHMQFSIVFFFVVVVVVWYFLCTHTKISQHTLMGLLW